MKLSKTVGGLNVPPTKRAKFETIWFDLIYSSPANQLFRSRTQKYKDIKSIDELITDRSQYRDEQDQIRQDLIEVVFDCWVHDWGGWDDQGAAIPLYDDEGSEVPCTIDNFSEVVRDHPGGEYLFFEIIAIAQRTAWFKNKQQEEEKNFLRPSQGPSSKGTSQPTPSARKRAPRSRPSKQ